MKTANSNRPARLFSTLAVVALTATFYFASTHTALAKSDPDAVKIVKSMIKAHGGMNTWRSAPTVSFKDDFKPAGAPAKSVAVSVISWTASSSCFRTLQPPKARSPAASRSSADPTSASLR